MANPVGRPTEYNPDYCEMLIEDMEKGYGLASFAGKIGVSKQTAYDWTKKYPEFLDAMQIGLAKSERFFETQGILGMVGKHKKFNAAVWSLMMQNKFGFHEKKEVTTKSLQGQLVDAMKGEDV